MGERTGLSALVVEVLKPSLLPRNSSQRRRCGGRSCRRPRLRRRLRRCRRSRSRGSRCRRRRLRRRPCSRRRRGRSGSRGSSRSRRRSIISTSCCSSVAASAAGGVRIAKARVVVSTNTGSLARDELESQRASQDSLI